MFQNTSFFCQDRTSASAHILPIFYAFRNIPATYLPSYRFRCIRNEETVLDRGSRSDRPRFRATTPTRLKIKYVRRDLTKDIYSLVVT